MRISRLELAFPDGAPGRTLILGADGAEDLSPFDTATTLVVEGMAQQHAALKARGFEVAAIDMSEISKTGGGIHCMAQALKRVP